MRQVALWLALIACSLGVALCRFVVASANRSGVYRVRDRVRLTIVQSRQPAEFSAALVWWKVSARAFATGALVSGILWATLKLVDG